jgi:uncharacterized membrane protein
LGVFKITVAGVLLVTVIVKTVLVRVDNIMPRAVEVDVGASVAVLYKVASIAARTKYNSGER